MAQLHYRFPNDSIIVKTGAFEECSDKDLLYYEGFVLGHFDNSTFYVFKEGKEEVPRQQLVPTILNEVDYLNLAESYINRMQGGDLDKVILSRIQQENFEGNPVELFQKLCNNFPNAFVYLIESKQVGTWIGASPEILLDVEEGRAKIMSLAGTKKIDDNSTWGEKEIVEQGIVTQFLRKEIQAFAGSSIDESEVFERFAGPVKHLCSDLEFNLLGSPIDFITRIHPTPAVCGQPRDAALKLIQESEPHERLFYAGIIGELNRERTRMYVNLRCAQIIEDKIYLYVGGGLTKDSSITDEWNETLNKAETIRQFL